MFLHVSLLQAISFLDVSFILHRSSNRYRSHALPLSTDLEGQVATSVFLLRIKQFHQDWFHGDVGPPRAAPNFLPWHDPFKNTRNPGSFDQRTWKDLWWVFRCNWSLRIGPDFVWHSHPEKPLSPRMVAWRTLQGVCSWAPWVCCARS